MGVPKFYRWISERYPCLSQVVKDYQIPEFDNFYLDMNGIIHTCSHPNDDDPSFRISEDKIFNSIFNYLEALFRIIKPQRVLFLAVDGVAPRAKMNQQRGRRFRSAKEAQDVVRRALQKGQVLPTEPRFDSNCITPGTEFMARLHEHLKYFVAKKLVSDPTWQKIEVVLSGHDVPGEGEHKIMDYIRHQKAQVDYDPNTRHCLYGLDADLIMLGLLSHEPHFSLLREEVRFGKSQKKQTTPDTITFHLLHLSILREYLDFEFQVLKGKLEFGYNLESVIDDWVLMGFLVGNDFLPNLPNFHIRQDALPFLYKKYIEVLPTLDGYINIGGSLNMTRFEAYMKAVSQFDFEHYSELFDDMKWLEGRSQLGQSKRKRHSPTEHAQSDQPASTEGPPAEMFPNDVAGFVGGVDEVDYQEDSEEVQKIKRDLGITNLQIYFNEEDKDHDKNFNKEFIEFKATYYKQKLGFIHVDQAVLLEQAKCYVVGIQWVLHYYYSGVPSWSWFYPYHYAPFVSDIRGFSDILIEFELGKPFLPFEQLLAVLPPASGSLLPKAFQGLMVNEDSPVKDFYPINFQTDLNGKDQEWEAVVLISFIEEDRLLQAMVPCLPHLTQEEIARNGFGKCLVSHYDQAAPSMVHRSPWPQVFPDIDNCHISCTELPPIPFPVAKDAMVRGLCKGVKLDVHFPGFPTLKHIPHTGILEKRGVRVFQAASRGENLFLTLKHSNMGKDCHEVARELVGKTLFVGWPYLVEAKVCAVSNGKEKYHNNSTTGGGKSEGGVVSLRREVLSEGGAKQWREDKTIISRRYLERQGIEIGNVELLLYAQVLQGKRYNVSKHGARGAVALIKEWSSLAEPFVYQTSVKDILAFAPEYKEEISSLTDLFPPKSHCFVTSPPHYGSLAEVVSVDMTQLRVQVKVIVQPEPELHSIATNHKLSIRYLPSHVVANKVGLPPVALARITGNIQVEKGSRDNVKSREKVKIGLNWKFSKRNQEILGYARKQENGGWSFSPEAIDILKNFIKQFPVMFSYIRGNPSEEIYYEQDMFPVADSPETISSVKEWLKALPSDGVDAVDCGSLTLDKPQIAAIEKAVYDMQRQKNDQTQTKPLKLRVKSSALFKPANRQGNLIPDPDADYYLFDRVINVSTTSAVPFALRGTVTGIMGESKDNGPTLYEVLFDEEFLGGLKLRCFSKKAYRLPSSCLLNISHGKRLEERKTHKSHKSATHSGTSYANAAMYAQYDHHGRGKSHGHGTRESTGFRTEYGNRGNERYSKNGCDPSTSSKTRSGAENVRKILPRNSTDSPKWTEKKSSHDELAAAVDALSKLSITSKPSEKEKKSKPTKNESTNKAKELSPSVMAMFNAHEKQQETQLGESSETTDSGSSSMQEHSTNLKSMLRIGESNKTPAEGVHKPLINQQPRGPLLPRPPIQYAPPPQQLKRPILFPHGPGPVYPYGPPVLDPISTLYQKAFSLGFPQPNVFHRNTPEGFVGFVEVGARKYTSPPSANPMDAKQSAAALANADLSKLPYPPIPYGYPMMSIPHGPRYSGPPLPLYPPQQLPPRSIPPYRLGRGLLSQSPFVPLQVQRRHPVKSSPEKKPVLASTQQVNEHQISSNQAQRLQTATKDIMQSLNLTPSSESPVTDHEEQSSDKSITGQLKEDTSVKKEELIKQVEMSSLKIKETKETIQRLGGILNAVAADTPVSSEAVPTIEDSTPHPKAAQHVGDAIVHTLLTNAMNQHPSDDEQYTEAVQPVDTAQSSVAEVVIAGEIVGTTATPEPRNSPAGATQSVPSVATSAKKPRRQIAASFMNL